MFAGAKVVQIERKTKYIWIFPRCSLPSSVFSGRITHKKLKIIKRQQIFHFSLFTFHLNFVTLQPE